MEEALKKLYIVLVRNMLSKMFYHYKRHYVSNSLHGAQVFVDYLSRFREFFFLLCSIKDLILSSYLFGKTIFILNLFLASLEFLFLSNSNSIEIVLIKIQNQYYKIDILYIFLNSIAYMPKPYKAFYCGKLLLFKEAFSIKKTQIFHCDAWSFYLLLSLCFRL